MLDSNLEWEMGEGLVGNGTLRTTISYQDFTVVYQVFSINFAWERVLKLQGMGNGVS